MVLVYFIASIFVALILIMSYKLDRLKDVISSHKIANTSKFTNDARFNESFNIITNPTDEKTFYLRPIVNLDDKNLRSIVFINNVISIMFDSNKKLLFELNINSNNKTIYYFLIDNYKIDGGQSISSNLITNNFPKLYENNANHHNILNLRDLGYDYDIIIKTEDIVSLTFNGKNREMVLITNNINELSFIIKYKNKQDMVEKIKNTSLYRHVMQWGLPGFADVKMSYVNIEGVDKDGNN